MRRLRRVPYTDEALSEESELLQRFSLAWNLALSAEACDRLMTFVSRLLEWNARINLTGAKSKQDLLGEHLIDSFAMTRFLPAGCSLADVGAGGGLPGIPLGILRPDIRLVMVEPRAKRVAFLRAVSYELGLKGIEILRCRSDELQPGSFDVCGSRATFPPDEWLRIGGGLAKVGGRVLLFTNEPWRPTDSAARLEDSVLYASSSGRPRWMGAFCFT
jgi:16S rRNA (guanine527-N7)-methyltransferase